MAARTYAQVNASVLGSRKFRGLTHRARWVWLCALLKADFSGFSEYPAVLWAIHAEIDTDELNEAINDLVQADLIEWSEENETVRITGFHRQRPPDNASASKRLICDFGDRLSSADEAAEGMVLRASAEFAVAAVARSTRWDAESKDRPKLREAIGQFLREVTQDFGDAFLAILDAELKDAGRPTRNEFESLLPSLSLYRQNTLAARSPHPVDTRNVDKTKHKQDQNQNEDRNSDDCVEAFEEHPSDAQAQASDLHRNQPRPTVAALNSALAQGKTW